jgi:hypothetical protein
MIPRSPAAATMVPTMLPETTAMSPTGAPAETTETTIAPAETTETTIAPAEATQPAVIPAEAT